MSAVHRAAVWLVQQGIDLPSDLGNVDHVPHHRDLLSDPVKKAVQNFIGRLGSASDRP